MFKVSKINIQEKVNFTQNRQVLRYRSPFGVSVANFG